jgi:hypothetical protein
VDAAYPGGNVFPVVMVILLGIAAVYEAAGVIYIVPPLPGTA